MRENTRPCDRHAAVEEFFSFFSFLLSFSFSFFALVETFPLRNFFHPMGKHSKAANSNQPPRSIERERERERERSTSLRRRLSNFREPASMVNSRDEARFVRESVKQILSKNVILENEHKLKIDASARTTRLKPSLDYRQVFCSLNTEHLYLLHSASQSFKKHTAFLSDSNDIPLCKILWITIVPVFLRLITRCPFKLKINNIKIGERKGEWVVV